MSITPYNVKQGQAHAVQVQAYTASATLPPNTSGVVPIGGGSATTITLADPTEDGLILDFVTISAQAHVVTNAGGSGFNGAGAGSDVATFTAAVGNNLRVVSYSGAWYVLNNVNATLA